MQNPFKIIFPSKKEFTQPQKHWPSASRLSNLQKNVHWCPKVHISAELSEVKLEPLRWKGQGLLAHLTATTWVNKLAVEPDPKLQGCLVRMSLDRNEWHPHPLLFYLTLSQLRPGKHHLLPAALRTCHLMPIYFLLSVSDGSWLLPDSWHYKSWK